MEKMMEKMKKMFALMMVIAIVLCFSGCVRYKVSAKVNKDGTIDVTFLYAQIDSSDMMGSGEVEGFADAEDDEEWGDELAIDGDDAGDEEGDDELRAKFEAAGWTVEDYADEEKADKKYYGYTATKNGIKLDELGAEFEKLGITSEQFTLEEKDGKYILDWNTQSNTKEVSEQLEEMGLATSAIKSYGGYMTFVLELPGKAKDNNATKVDGKIYEWDMFKMNEPIHCEFTLKGDGFPAWIIGVIVGGVIIAAGVVVAIILMGKKKKIDAEKPLEVPVIAKDPTPAEKLAQTTFETSQTDGLPQFGQASAEAPAETSAEDATDAPAAPLWAQPSSDASETLDDLNDLDNN
ncbi:MAG: hypothetical protein IK020_03950 [Clostridiales bacterium]|nr:hypothetical protein [Clostridiales bacterium]